MLHSNYLKQLDLQDIVVFLNLLEQRSAKRTAELMSISQPTVSYCLKRLRGCFDDTLFASSQGALLPTTKAEKSRRICAWSWNQSTAVQRRKPVGPRLP